MADNRQFKKRYILMALILVILAGGTLLLPEKYVSEELSPENLLKEINDNTRYIYPDDIAHLIISKDPNFLLIDVRDSASYQEFKLPGAINIPLKNLLDKDDAGDYKWEGFLNQDTRKNIFYSNGTVYSHQAWMLTKRLNYENNYVMKGGLNKWIETIIQVRRPEFDASEQELATYTFRKAASMFFGGGGTAASDDPVNIPAFTGKKKEKEVQEGC
ncbi:MAG: rhodanese-like domain-containing protein [Bacteroidales bacterium]|nr:rhodanese-like domain-containing protein [Bacteroidales bacterium]